jgi:hypothetical protein
MEEPAAINCSSIMSSAAMTLIFLWLFQRQGLMTELVQFISNNRWYIAAFIAIVVHGPAGRVERAAQSLDDAAGLVAHWTRPWCGRVDAAGDNGVRISRSPEATTSAVSRREMGVLHRVKGGADREPGRERAHRE